MKISTSTTYCPSLSEVCKFYPRLAKCEGCEAPSSLSLDNALFAAIGRLRMEKFRAATSEAEAMFCVTDPPDTTATNVLSIIFKFS